MTRMPPHDWTKNEEAAKEMLKDKLSYTAPEKKPLEKK